MKKFCAIELIALSIVAIISFQIDASQQAMIGKRAMTSDELPASKKTKTNEVKLATTIYSLPDEIIIKIFKYLDTKSKLKFACLSKQFKAIADYQRSLVLAIDSESKDYMNQDFNFYKGPQLKRISIKGKSLENINLTHLRLCENLEELTLTDVKLTEKQYENLVVALLSLPHLEVLNLSGISVPTWGGMYLTRT